MTNYFGEALRRARQKAREFPRRMDVAYPSDASVEIVIGNDVQVHGGCLRRQYYRITETPETDPESAERSFVAEMGELAHIIVGQVFGAAERLIHAEPRIWIEEVRLSGRIDVIFANVQQAECSLGKHYVRKRIGCEVKTVAGYYGRRGVIEERRGVPFYPRIYDLAQAVVYLDYLNQHQNYEIDEWILLYICRETGKWKEHQILYRGHDDILVNGQPTTITPKAVYDRWKRLWEHVESKTLPTRDYALRYSDAKIARMADAGDLNRENKKRYDEGKKVDLGDKQCREWCPWRTQCWKHDKELV